MNRRRFLAQAAALPITVSGIHLNASSASANSHNDVDSAESAGRPLYTRYTLTRNRVLAGNLPTYSADFLLADLSGEPGRRFTNFSGDLSGRWIGALASCGATYKEDFPALRPFVESALKLQHPEGYFGKSFNAQNPSDDDLALLWGNGRLLVGLNEYYALTQDQDVLRAARKLGDFLVGIAPIFNSRQMEQAFGSAHFATSYICWTQQTEGLAGLYALTRDDRYRDVCAAITQRISRRPGDHVHGFLCSVRGALELYKQTGDKDLLQTVQRHWRDVMNSGDILVTGGVPEAWSPKRLRTEGCAECDWLRLNLELHGITGQDEYLRVAEDVLFNEFSMNQFKTGDFGHAVLGDRGQIASGTVQTEVNTIEPAMVVVRAWWCCTLHGLRAFADIQAHAFRPDKDELLYAVPIDGSFQSAELRITARSQLASHGEVNLKVEKASPNARLRVRQPHWAEKVILSRNGQVSPDSTFNDLKRGDVITAEYVMKLQLSPVRTNPERKLIHMGPWLLGASSAIQPDYFNELYPLNMLHERSIAASEPKEGSPFAVPVAAHKASVIPAEFPEQPATVELRAVAEQTAQAPSRWVLSFATDPGTQQT
jgi:DUF1680 family protein